MSSVARFLIVLSVGALALPAWSAEPSRNPAHARSISVTGQGEAFGRPDIAEVNAGVQTFAETVVDASRENQALVDRVFEALQQQGVDEKDIRTSDYSIWPRQDYNPARGDRKPRVTGYQVSNMVHVKVRDIDRIGEVLAAVTNAGANSINGIQFGVEDAAALETRARRLAMEDARERAESLASLAGVELGDVLAISMSSAPGFPIPYARGRMMEMADAGAPVPGIQAGQQSVTVNIDVTWAIR